MDRDIYFKQNRSDLGNFIARRLPKSSGSVVIPGGGSLSPGGGGGGAAVGGGPGGASVAGSVPAASNPTPLQLTYAGQLDEHSSTLRVEYTVPKGRRTIIQSAFARVQRAVAAGVSGTYAMQIGVQRANSGGIAANAATNDLCLALNNSNVVGTSLVDHFHGTLELFEGDRVVLYTSDPDSTVNGQVYFAGNVLGVEYDSESKPVGLVSGVAISGDYEPTGVIESAAPLSGTGLTYSGTGYGGNGYFSGIVYNYGGGQGAGFLP
jgi:hypothetical protein